MYKFDLKSLDCNDPSFFAQMYAALEFYEFLSVEEVERLKSASQSSSFRADKALIELGLLNEDELLRFWHLFLSLPTFVEEDLPEAPILPDLIPINYLLGSKVLPIRFEEQSLWLATNDPIDTKIRSSLEYLLDVNVKLVLASENQIQLGLQSLYFLKGRDRYGRIRRWRTAWGR